MHTHISSYRKAPRAFAWPSAFLMLAAAACDNDPAKGSTQAEVSAPVEKAAAPEAPKAGGVTYTFSPADSKVSFVGAKVTGKHDGGFNTFAGTIQFVDNDPVKSSVVVELDNASIFTDTEKLTNHLKSADFFDVARFPKTRFSSTAIAASAGAAGATHTVTGNLELHGVTKQISFPATIRVAGERIEVDADFAINRKDFGIVYAGMPDDLIQDNVRIVLQIRAARAPQA